MIERKRCLLTDRIVFATEYYTYIEDFQANIWRVNEIALFVLICMFNRDNVPSTYIRAVAERGSPHEC
jgi:hypothetical protein